MWIYKGRRIENIQDLRLDYEPFGFIYKITNTITGWVYIGKKNFYTRRKKNLPKKLLSTDKRKKTYQIIVAESTWLNYWGSSNALLFDLDLIGKHQFKREIIDIACSTKMLSYLELKHMFAHEVLEKQSYNGNIMGKFFMRDLENKCL